MQQKSVKERVAQRLDAARSDFVWCRCMHKSSCLDNICACKAYSGNKKEPLLTSTG